jgi:hypothetical protein
MNLSDSYINQTILLFFNPPLHNHYVSDLVLNPVVDRVVGNPLFVSQMTSRRTTGKGKSWKNGNQVWFASQAGLERDTCVRDRLVNKLWLANHMLKQELDSKDDEIKQLKEMLKVQYDIRAQLKEMLKAQYDIRATINSAPVISPDKGSRSEGQVPYEKDPDESWKGKTHEQLLAEYALEYPNLRVYED